MLRRQNGKTHFKTVQLKIPVVTKCSLQCNYCNLGHLDNKKQSPCLTKIKFLILKLCNLGYFFSFLFSSGVK